MGLPYRGPAPTADDQILTRGQAKLLAGYMTTAQRVALTGADLWAGRRVIETDTGRTWVYSTVGAYWFMPSAQASLTRSGGRVNVSSQFLVPIPFNVLDSNDDTNLYTTNLTAGTIRVNRGGLYRVSTLVYMGQSVLDYIGVLIMQNGGVVREVDAYAVAARLTAAFDFRLIDPTTAGSGPVFGTSMYAQNSGAYYDTTGTANMLLQVARIGD